MCIFIYIKYILIYTVTCHVVVQVNQKTSQLQLPMVPQR
jgi:hypothetical protein